MPEITFRDGPRQVPPHVADLMESIETYKLTFDEALRQMNNRFMGDFLYKAQNKMINEHFRKEK